MFLSGYRPRGARYLQVSAPKTTRSSGSPVLRSWRAWLLAGLLAAGIGGDISATESWQVQREAFRLAEQSLQAGASVDYAALRGYPLYPYLRYRDISRRLPAFPATEVREFLQIYSDTPLADRLRNAWLRQLAGAQRWDDYLRDAVPSRDPTFECWRRQALLKTGQTQ
ncbi:MAG: hypothetical protein KDJ34_02110, partial [Candidatus Competibacteraceae bacterium]|nr:hypothetical protein [Candidatus Competibacteraceae bacterium]